MWDVKYRRSSNQINQLPSQLFSTKVIQNARGHRLPRWPAFLSIVWGVCTGGGESSLPCFWGRGGAVRAQRIRSEHLPSSPLPVIWSLRQASLSQPLLLHVWSFSVTSVVQCGAGVGFFGGQSTLVVGRSLMILEPRFKVHIGLRTVFRVSNPHSAAYMRLRKKGPGVLFALASSLNVAGDIQMACRATGWARQWSRLGCGDAFLVPVVERTPAGGRRRGGKPNVSSVL